MCALSLSPDFFVRCLLDRFHVLDLLTFAGRDVRLTRSVLDVENEQAMMEGALALICTLLTTRTMLAASDQEITKYVLSAEEWGGGEGRGGGGRVGWRRALACICTLLTTRTMLAASDQEITMYALWAGGRWRSLSCGSEDVIAEYIQE